MGWAAVGVLVLAVTLAVTAASSLPAAGSKRTPPAATRGARAAGEGARSVRLFGHLRWRNQFELDNVVAPIVAGDEYDLGEQRFDPADVVIDVGAHIGVFATVCHRRGSRAIHCYEPDASNFELLESNVGQLPGVHLKRAAIWRSDDGAGTEVLLSGADGDNTGACSVLAGGRALDFATQTVADRSTTALRVGAVPLDAVLAAHDRVDLLKLDCEGSEFPILLTSRELHRVRRIVGEIHELTEAAMDRLSPASRVGGYRAYSVDVLVACLESHGFEVHTRQTSPHLFLFSARRREAVEAGGSPKVSVTGSSSSWLGRRRLQSSDRYVVSMRSAGLGDRIISLGAAWLFARNTGRTLVADWRHSLYSLDFGSNLFEQCFQPLSELAGVRFIADDRIADLRLPRPRYPARWNNDRALASPLRRPRYTPSDEHAAAVAMIRGGTDVSAPTVVFDACINDGLVSIEHSRAFLSALRPAGHVAERVAVFRRNELHGARTIGLHVRHGNGAETGHASYWQTFEAAMARCVRATRKAREMLGSDALVLLCTDSAEVETAIRSLIPNVVCRAKTFRPSGAGELHGWRGAHHGRDDALVEMLLLAECDALIRYPPGSFFTFYPQ